MPDSFRRVSGAPPKGGPGTLLRVAPIRATLGAVKNNPGGTSPMQSGDPFAPFFGALQNFNELVFRSGAPDLAETFRRNLDAIEHANRLIMDGALEASRRQSEIMRSTMEDIAKAARSVAGSKSPMEAGAVQGEMVRTTVTATIQRMQEVNEAMARANAEALELLRDRLIASIQETYGQK